MQRITRGGRRHAATWNATMVTSIDAPSTRAAARTSDQTSIAEWMCRIRAEYLEAPGLNLTRPQARRLWGLDAATCDRALNALVEARFLRLTASGTYVLAD